ncbi:MAG: NAD(P)-binding domain-containing protein, partial [Phycisphaerales bacterium]|nr:NAD(P)-binding domain-containing protein [Phycisphaerales bacterium]
MSDNYELAVIGAGTMAEAIVRGAFDTGYLCSESVVACDLNPERRDLFETEFGVATTDDLQVCAPCPYILLATKPFNVDEVLAAVAPGVHEGVTVISVCAGITTKQISDALGGKARVVRAMPNTPTRVGAGATAIAPGPNCQDENLEWARRLFAASGLSVVMPE